MNRNVAENSYIHARYCYKLFLYNTDTFTCNVDSRIINLPKPSFSLVNVLFVLFHFISKSECGLTLEMSVNCLKWRYKGLQKYSAPPESHCNFLDYKTYTQLSSGNIYVEYSFNAKISYLPTDIKMIKHAVCISIQTPLLWKLQVYSNGKLITNDTKVTLI